MCVCARASQRDAKGGEEGAQKSRKLMKFPVTPMGKVQFSLVLNVGLLLALMGCMIGLSKESAYFRFGPSPTLTILGILIQDDASYAVLLLLIALNNCIKVLMSTERYRVRSTIGQEGRQNFGGTASLVRQQHVLRLRRGGLRSSSPSHSWHCACSVCAWSRR